MSQQIAIVTDNAQRSADVAGAVPASHDVEIVDLTAAHGYAHGEPKLVIVDVPLNDGEAIAALRNHLRNVQDSPPNVFIADESRRQETVQAHSLGARQVMSRQRLVQQLPGLLATAPPKGDVKRAVAFVENVNEDMFTAVQNGGKLPRNQVEECGDLIAHNLKDVGISAWLDEVKNHHSYTHRHSMHVTAFAVSFGLRCGMRDLDVQRLAAGALLHDIGKAQIPIEILDKPGKLTAQERLQIREHPGLSAQVLIDDGQFDDEVVEVARHHHEYLDGSGYPDGFAGDQIGDLVRIISIADVFSALVDRRAYKAAIPKPKAYGMLVDMAGKLDGALVQTFEPIALGQSLTPRSF
jgi:putative nucleotidyltransferase with HDIG domain